LNTKTPQFRQILCRRIAPSFVCHVFVTRKCRPAAERASARSAAAGEAGEFGHRRALAGGRFGGLFDLFFLTHIFLARAASWAMVGRSWGFERPRLPSMTPGTRMPNIDAPAAQPQRQSQK
jgi:hypothetical protein